MPMCIRLKNAGVSVLGLPIFPGDYQTIDYSTWADAVKLEWWYNAQDVGTTGYVVQVTGRIDPKRGLITDVKEEDLTVVIGQWTRLVQADPRRISFSVARVT